MGNEHANEARQGELIEGLPSNVTRLHRREGEGPQETREQRRERQRQDAQKEKTAEQEAAVKAVMARAQQREQQGSSEEAKAGEGYARRITRYELDDVGNAARLEHHFGEVLRYIAPWRQWLWWDGVRWQRDQTRRIGAYAMKAVDKILEEVAYTESLEEQLKIIAHWSKSRSSGKISAMVKLAEPMMALEPGLLAESAHHLVTASGIVDLRTGQLCPPDTEDYSLRWTNVPYEPDAKCPRWRRFIAEVMAGDRQMMRLLQRIAGYSATGSSIEQALLIFSGSGNNGKGCYLRTISRALGEYALAAHPDFLHKRRHVGHPTDIAMLQGARLVVVSELGAGDRVDEARLKVLTGGDILRGRHIAKDFSEFGPTFTIILQTNNLPQITSMDDGTWRRLQIIPWRQQWAMPGREKQMPGLPVADPDLEEKLAEELPGILAWCVRGAVQWYERRLDFPETVKEATLAYRQEQDELAAFTLAHLVPQEGARTSTSAAYEAYGRFQAARGLAAMTQTAFGTRMNKRYRMINTAKGRVYLNVRLVEPPEEGQTTES